MYAYMNVFLEDRGGSGFGMHCLYQYIGGCALMGKVRWVGFGWEWIVSLAFLA